MLHVELCRVRVRVVDREVVAQRAVLLVEVAVGLVGGGALVLDALDRVLEVAHVADGLLQDGELVGGDLAALRRQ